MSSWLLESRMIKETDIVVNSSRHNKRAIAMHLNDMTHWLHYGHNIINYQLFDHWIFGSKNIGCFRFMLDISKISTS